MQTEVWKDIQGYPKYQVSNFGRVRSYMRNREWVLKSDLNSMGYYRTDLKKDGLRKRYFNHRLVAQTFIHNAENKPCINHIDGNKLNNHVSNLEWCTFSENSKHAYKTGLVPYSLLGSKGEKHPMCKLSESQVYEIRGMHNNLKITAIAKLFGVHKSTIGLILKNKIWKHLL